MLEERNRFNDVEMPIYYMEHKKLNHVFTSSHYHSYVELLYILEGHSMVRVDGIDYTLDTGDMIIINSREEHETCALDDFSHELVVKFEPGTLNLSEDYAYNFKYILPVLLKNNRQNRIFRRSEIENTYIPSALKNGLSECQRTEYGFEIAMKAEVLRVFLWIIRKWESSGEISPYMEQNIRILEPALKYAQSEFAYATAHEAAKYCSLSYSYFSKLFKKTFNQSFTAYINNIKICESKILLINTDKSITDIAMESGFSTTSYFIQVFKNIVGETPRRARRLFLKPLSDTEL